MPTFKWSELTHEAIDGEYSPVRAPVYRGDKIEVARAVYEAGRVVRQHADPHEQIHSLLSGTAQYRVGDDERIVAAGDAVLIRPNTPYSIQVLERAEVIVFKDVNVAGGTPDGAMRERFFTWSAMKSDFITPKYSSGRGPTITGERIEVAFMFYPAGTEGKPHQHPNEQIQVPLAGTVRGTIGGEEIVIGPGEGVLVPSNVVHGAWIIEDYTTINCKDIVPGFSVFHAAWEK